ncbi:MAG: FlgD immunoglobulin-like domain containing protein [Fidelibacterota bacterium]
MTVTATDDSSASVADTLLLSVVKPNARPVANAGPDQSVFHGTVVVLDGSGSTDPEGAPLSFRWQSPPEITLSDSTAEKPSFTSPDVADETVFSFSLVVNDGELDSNVDTVLVTVFPLFQDLPDFSEQPPEIGEPITITVTVPDFFVVDTMNLNYITGGQSRFERVRMTPAGRSTTFSGVIPGEAVTVTGVAYFIYAVDTLSTRITSRMTAIPVIFPSGAVTSRISGSPFADGFPRRKWRLVSVPTKLDDRAVSSIFDEEFGVEPGEKTWKLYEWTGSDWVYAEQVEPGRGYWLHQRVRDNIFFTAGSGQSVDLTGTTLSLNPGWNLLSSPYPFLITVKVDSALFSGPWTYGDYDGEGGMDNATLLQPWGGYALYNWTDTVQPLELHPLEGVEGHPEEGSSPAGGWTLQLMALGNRYSDKSNYIGRSEDARDGLDRKDQPEPPYVEGYVSLSMDHPEWGHRVTRFSRDIRSTESESDIWDVNLHVRGESGAIAFLHAVSGEFPEDHEVWLLDLTTRQAYNLAHDPRIVVQTYSEKFPNHYKIVYGPSGRIQQLIKDVWSQLPSDFSLFQNYPNPFNPITTIRYVLKEPAHVNLVIYDLLGRQVRTLVSGPQDLGTRSVSWKGRDKHGREVSTGVYLYRITVNPLSGNSSFVQTRKMILLK